MPASNHEAAPHVTGAPADGARLRDVVRQADTPLRRFRRGTAVRVPEQTETGSAPLVALAGFFAFAWIAYTFINAGQATPYDYYVRLADAFLHGRLYLLNDPSWLNELVPYHGHFYVVYPPIPAVLLLPFVWLFGPGLDQSSVSILLGAFDVAIAADVLYRMGLRGRTWAVFTLLFGFGTIFWFSAQVGSAWHFAHVCAMLFMLLAVRETLLGGPPWRAGVLVGLAGLARLPVLASAPFFLAYVAFRADRQQTADDERPAFATVAGERGSILTAQLDVRRLARGVVGLGVGAAAPVLVYFAYNAVRFGSPLQEGYSLIPGLLQEAQYRYGFLAIENVGRNLYALLLQMPRQVSGFPWIQPAQLGGLSILFTTPAFLWTIRARTPNWSTLGAWLSIAAISVPILLHADPGGLEFGYRYALDFYPFAFLLMVRGMEGELNFEKGLAIGLSFLVNLWGMWAFLTGFVAPG